MKKITPKFIFENIEEIVASLLFVVTLVLVIINVLTRYVFRTGIPWAEEMATSCFVWTAFIGSAACYKMRAHVGVDILVNKLPLKVQNVVKIIVDILMAFLCAYLFYLSCVYLKRSYRKPTAILGVSSAWVSSSLMSCMAPVVLSDVFGVEITEEDEKMLRGEYEAEKERYGGVQEYFIEKKLVGTAPIAQAFYLLYMDRVLARPDTYLQDLAYCFEDGVKLRNIQRVKERFGIEMTEEDLNIVLEYARDTRIPTENYKTYKNSTDLAKFASWVAGKWKYRENTAGDVLTIDQIYRSQDVDDWTRL